LCGHSWRSGAGTTTIATSLAILALSGGNTGEGLATITGNIVSVGNATGTIISQESVVFTGATTSTYTVKTDDFGNYTVNLPVGAYTINLSSEIYYLNGSAPTINVAEGEYRNLTGNLSALPIINVTGAYGALGYISVSSAEESSAANIGGVNVKYAHSGLTVNNTATYTIVSTQTSTHFAQNGLITSGNFTKAVTLPAVTETTSYKIFITVSDGDSSTVYTDTVTVTNADSSDDSSSASAGGGGGGSSNYGILISEYDKKVTANQGETKSTKLIAKNSGIKSLEKVALTLVGISSDWYTTSVSSTGGSAEDLVSGEVVIFDIKFEIPNDATAKVYAGTWRVTDKDGLALAEKHMNLTIVNVWTADSISTLNTSIADAKPELTELAETIAKLKRKGKNVTELEAKLIELNQSLQDADAKFATGEYTTAQNFLNTANDLITELQAGIDEIEGFKLDFEGITPSRIGVFAFVLVIAAAAGILLWYKFMRVLTIAEIKKNPDRYLEGAHLEGVVKSITDTKKGKVFLIQDHTGKLHVRYPYYTTTEVGDMLRARGVVKTYKNIPYMDATDLQRVSVGRASTGIKHPKLKLNFLKPRK